jgi:hypothetical protein
MFINYYARRDQPMVNQSIVRVFFTCYIIWKISAYDWAFLAEWPEYLFDERQAFLRQYAVHVYFGTVACLAAFAIGLFTPVASLGGAFGLMLLGGIHQAVDNQGKRLLVPAFVVLILGVHRKCDWLSVDRLRHFFRLAPEARDRLLAGPNRSAQDGLGIALLVIALTYFLTAFGRIVHGSYSGWTDPSNLRRTLHIEAMKNLGLPGTWLGSRVINAPDAVVSAFSHGTMFAELGLLVAVLTRLPIWPFVVGLAMLHTGIFLSMHLLFVESFALLLPMLDWARIVSLFEKRDAVAVRYDVTRAGVATFLMAVKQFDVRQAFTFMPLPGRDAANVEQTWCEVQIGDATWRNASALLRLVAQFRGVASLVAPFQTGAPELAGTDTRGTREARLRD